VRLKVESINAAILTSYEKLKIIMSSLKSMASGQKPSDARKKALDDDDARAPAEAGSSAEPIKPGITIDLIGHCVTDKALHLLRITQCGSHN